MVTARSLFQSSLQLIETKMKKNKIGLWLLLVVSVVLIDIVIKQCIVRHFNFAEPYYLLPFLNITLAYNRGAAFGFLNGQSGWQVGMLSLIAVVVSVGIIYWLRKISNQYPLQSCGISLVLGGAIGNLIDRIHYGYVIDFIDFHINHWHFAFFNMADAAITIGVVLLIIDFLLRGNKREKNSTGKS